jgi:hypothetical protein
MKQSISSWGRIEKSVHDTISLNSSDTLPLKSSKKGLFKSKWLYMDYKESRSFFIF